jgi:membrane-associated phospholipid phosphatase
MNMDVSLIVFLQSYPGLLPLMKLASLLGTKEFFLLLLPAIYWCKSTAQGFRLGLMLTISYGINAFFKVLWHSPRPYWVSRDVFAWSHEGSYGLPSGHAQIAASFWGLLAYSMQNRRALAAAALLSILIGISRIYLGVHFPLDVLTGWAIGTGILIVFLFCEKAIGERLSRQGLTTQIALSFAASLALLLLFVLGRSASAGFQIPDIWQANAFAETSLLLNPESSKDALSAAGMLVGISSGYAIMKKQGCISIRGPARKKALRYLLGMAGLFLIWYGLESFAAVSDIMRYFQSALACFWVSCLAPLCFLKAHLAEKGVEI